jgi:hypothetical protein
MFQSRLKRVQEQRLTKRLFLFIGLSGGLIMILLVFGFRILVGISLLFENLQGKPADTVNSVFIAPPALLPLPEATNSARIIITGFGEKGMDVTLYNGQTKEETITISDDGTFVFRNLILEDGNFSFTAIQSDRDGNKSAPSEPVNVTIKTSEPKLELLSPEADTTIRGEENRKMNISGATDEGNAVTLNGRIIVVSSDGTFSSFINLNEGENRLIVTATDLAGNSAITERLIKFEK